MLNAWLLSRQAQIPTLFPYTTLFRSLQTQPQRRVQVRGVRRGIAGKSYRTFVGISSEDPRFKLIFYVIVDHESSVGYPVDRKSTRLNSSHVKISYAVFCLKKT